MLLIVRNNISKYKYNFILNQNVGNVRPVNKK